MISSVGPQSQIYAMQQAYQAQASAAAAIDPFEEGGDAADHVQGLSIGPWVTELAPTAATPGPGSRRGTGLALAG